MLTAKRLLLVVLPLSRCATQANAGHVQRGEAGPHKLPPVAVQHALQRYGWALPLCVWPNRHGASSRSISTGTQPLFCVTVAELLKRFPFHRDFIVTRVIDVAAAAYSLDTAGPRTPESVMQKITQMGQVVGCVPKGSNKGAVTLGVTKPPDRAAAQACESPFESRTKPGVNLALGALVGTAPQTPALSLSADGQATYENYYQQCKERQRTGAAQRSVMEGNSPTDKQKKADKLAKEAEKKAKEAAQKQKEADQAKKEAEAAKQKQAEVDKKAQQTWSDPQATPADKQRASQDVIKAGNDAAAAEANANQKQKDADDAKKASDDATKAMKDAQADADYAKAVNDAVTDWAKKAAGGAPVAAFGPMGDALLAGWELGAAVEGTARVMGAASGRMGFECDEGGCGYPNCEAEARARAFVDEIMSYKPRFKCNTSATPVPDQDACYDRPGGLFDVPQVTLVEMVKMACKIAQKVSDRQCDRVMPARIFKTLFSDPCKSPYGMCAPESSPRSGGAPSGNLSNPIPQPSPGADPTMWVTPATGPTR